MSWIRSPVPMCWKSPLRTREHFQAAVGQKVKLKTVRALDGRKSFTGILKSVEGEQVTIGMDDGDVNVPLGDMSKANIIGTVEF